MDRSLNYEEQNVDFQVPLTSLASPSIPSPTTYSRVTTPSKATQLTQGSKKRRLQTTMNEFSIKTTAAQKEILDMKMARYFYANNIPFNTSSSKTFKEKVEALRPGYKPPNPESLGGSLLNKVSEEVDTELKLELQHSNCCITLLQDGWSSVRNDPILASSIHTGSKAFLLEAVDCGHEK
nr:uncharacterized protein LOC124818466 [Hydra vulgaris]